MYNSGDRKDIRRAEKAAAVAEKNRAAAIHRLMSSAADREFVWNFLESLSVFSTPWSENPYQVYFMLGEQNAGKKLLADILQFCPDEYITMTREANGRRSTADTIDANRAAGEQPRGEESGREPSWPTEPDFFDSDSAPAI